MCEHELKYIESQNNIAEALRSIASELRWNREYDQLDSLPEKLSYLLKQKLETKGEAWNCPNCGCLTWHADKVCTICQKKNK